MWAPFKIGPTRGFSTRPHQRNAGDSRHPTRSDDHDAPVAPDRTSRQMRRVVGRRSGGAAWHIAFASIWRIRSRVRPKRTPTSSSVRGDPRSMPNLQPEDLAFALVEAGQHLGHLARQQGRGGGRRTATPRRGPPPSRPARPSPSWPNGSDSEAGATACRRISATLSGADLEVGGDLVDGDVPAVFGLEAGARLGDLVEEVTDVGGRRMVRLPLAMPRVMAWRIHQVA